jgi:hypothetical protein
MLKPFTALFAGIIALNAGGAVQASPLQPNRWALSSPTGNIAVQQPASTCTKVFDPKDTYVNLRQTPNGRVLARLKNGTTVTVKKRSGGWSQVETGRLSGYVFTQLLTSCRR